jgi:hypothetical protein
MVDIGKRLENGNPEVVNTQGKTHIYQRVGGYALTTIVAGVEAGP